MRQMLCILMILIFVTGISFQEGANGEIVNFIGKINSKYPVSILLQIEPDLIFGHVIYLKGSKKPIKLIGNSDDSQLELTEYLEDGTVSGIWRGKIIKNEFSGIWYAVNGEKEFDFLLTKNDTIDRKLVTNIDSSSYVGHYEYHYGTEGYQGSITISKIRNHYHLSCSNVTKAPGRNMADFEIDTLDITNNESICDLNDDGQCVFKIKYYKDFIFINSIDGKRDCGFGFNAYVDGVYIKIN